MTLTNSQPGIGNLLSARDLFDKLERDLNRIKSDNNISDAAYDFFITAEHIVDWVFPGNENRENRRKLRTQSVLLQITSHIANGSKHFIVEAPHHCSVQHVDSCTITDVSNKNDSRSFKAGIYVTLEGEAAKILGSQIDVLSLAINVYQFWKDFFSNVPLT